MLSLSLFRLQENVLKDQCIHQTDCKAIARPHGVKVSPPDSESGNPSANLGGTLVNLMPYTKVRKTILRN